MEKPHDNVVHIGTLAPPVSRLRGDAEAFALSGALLAQLEAAAAAFKRDRHVDPDQLDDDDDDRAEEEGKHFTVGAAVSVPLSLGLVRRRNGVIGERVREVSARIASPSVGGMVAVLLDSGVLRIVPAHAVTIGPMW
jgi:hypothetical protein